MKTELQRLRADDVKALKKMKQHERESIGDVIHRLLKYEASDE